MLHRTLLFLLLTTLLGCQSAPTSQPHQPLSFAVGLQKKVMIDSDRARRLPLTIWYPAEGSNFAKTQSEGIYLQHYGTLNATPLSGSYPLVLLSHGTGGTASSLSWIAEYLAGEGFWVIGVDHPSDSWPNATPEGLLEVWQRPQDLSYILDALPRYPEIAQQIDFEQVAVLGHSSGGYTALALVGARYDVAALTEHCQQADAMPACGLADPDVIKRVDYSPSSLDYKDERIQAAVVMAPAIVPGLTQTSLEAIDVPVQLLYAEQDELLALTPTQVAKLNPSVQPLAHESGGHFIYISECNDMGKQVIAQICVDQDGIDRGAIHQQLQPQILDFLKQNISPSAN